MFSDLTKCTQNLDVSLLKQLLSDNMINFNKKNTKNILFKVINTMLAHFEYKFNIEFIELLIDHGANMDNILSFIFKKYDRFVSKNKSFYEIKIFELIQLLINKGANSCNQHNEKNTYSLSIKTKNLNIINLLRKNNCKPNNSDNYSINSLTEAVLTNDIEIVKISYLNQACENKTISKNNTLINAIYLFNVEIIKLIMINGGTHNEYNFMVDVLSKYNFDRKWIFEKFYNTCVKNNFQKYLKQIDEIINLLICHRCEIPESVYLDIISKTNRNLIDDKILEFKNIKMIFHGPIIIDGYIKKESKNQLQTTMDNLVKLSLDKENRIQEILNTIRCLPECISDIIFEYQYMVTIKVIDWLSL